MLEVEKRLSTWTDSRDLERTELIARQFQIADDVGAVGVDPDGAWLERGSSKEKTRIRSDEAVPTDLRRRIAALEDDVAHPELFVDPDEDAEYEFEEEVITPGDDVHVSGASVVDTSPSQAGVTVLVGEDPNAHRFAISVGDQSSVSRRRLAYAAGFIALGVGLIAGGLYMLPSFP